jgi:plasmid maintenance system killer protein
LRDALGVFAYDLAEFLYGPILSASLIIVIYALRQRIGERAFRRMDLALLAAVLSAVRMATVAFIRASNRHYHIIHPELNLENSSTVLIVWTTLVAGVNAIRINDQWRICFRWVDGKARDVEIVDYHG